MHIDETLPFKCLKCKKKYHLALYCTLCGEKLSSHYTTNEEEEVVELLGGTCDEVDHLLMTSLYNSQFCFKCGKKL